jgi:hypothetical protein
MNSTSSPRPAAPHLTASPLLAPLLTPGLLALGLLTLVACAPAAARSGVSGATMFTPGGSQLAIICGGGVRVGKSGTLIWQENNQTFTRPAPYLVACRDVTLANNGAVLSVQDDTLEEALARFDASANFLNYGKGLGVHLTSKGVMTADAAPTATPDALKGVNVLVSRLGLPDAALVNAGQVNTVRFDPLKPLTLRLQAPKGFFSASQVAWPEVTITAFKGLITAPVYK